MGIMTRISRIFKADIHGVMDQIENKELILKQCLREMETALAEKKESFSHLKISQDKNREMLTQFQNEREKIEQDLKTAVIKEKDEIARLLIRKRMQADRHINQATRHMESLEKQMTLLSEHIEAQKHQFAEMQLRAESWFQQSENQQWMECIPGGHPPGGWDAMSDAEVELELIKYKDIIQGGESSE